MKKILQAAAACLLLCAMLAALPLIPVPVLPQPQSQELVQPFFVTAEEITTYRGPLLLGGVGNYDYRYNTLDDRPYSPVGDGSGVEYLPAWQAMEQQDLLTLNEETAAQLQQTIAGRYGLSPLSRAVYAHGIEAPEDNPNYYEVAYQSSTVKLQYAGFMLEVDARTYAGRQQMHCSLLPGSGSAFAVTVPPQTTQTQLTEAVEPVLQFWRDVLGRDLTVCYSNWDDGDTADRYSLCAWEVTGDPAADLFSAYHDYVKITLQLLPDGSLQLQKAVYTRNLMEQSSEQLLPVIPLEEAAAQLAAGNAIYGWHCPVCQDGPEVDFTDYDAVEVRCYTAITYLRNIPVYAFYKQVEARKCAVAYYPAVEVQGLAEYFAAKHDHRGGDA